MLEPTEEETAMSPLPCFATNTLVIKSGTDVPAAMNVKPITCKGRVKERVPMTNDPREYCATKYLAYLWWYSNHVASHSRPPKQQVGVDSNPENTSQKRDGKVFALF
jgi:hypothetical protein